MLFSILPGQLYRFFWGDLPIRTAATQLYQSARNSKTKRFMVIKEANSRMSTMVNERYTLN